MQPRGDVGACGPECGRRALPGRTRARPPTGNGTQVLSHTQPPCQAGSCMCQEGTYSAPQQEKAESLAHL